MKKKIINEKKNFEKNGYTVIKNIFKKSEVEELKKSVLKKLNLISKKKINFENLKDIHKKKIDKEVFSHLMKSSTRFIFLNQKNLNRIKKNSNIQNILKNYWGHDNFQIYWVGDPKKKEVKKNKIGFRVARPKIKSDTAKSHIDNYSGNMKSFLTLWVPLVGFSSNYVLNVFPGTHKFNHNQKILKKRKSISKIFSVKYLKNYTSKRFSLTCGDAIIFHPNLIHGSSYNLGTITRASVEFRMFNNKNFSINKTFDKKYNK